jgi:hypothetical protein
MGVMWMKPLLKPEAGGHSVYRYKDQDKQAKRNILKNIKYDDFPFFKEFFTKCHIYNEKFSTENKPTLDRIDNKNSHTIENVKSCCQYCNCCKSHNNKKITKLRISIYIEKRWVQTTMGK